MAENTAQSAVVSHGPVQASSDGLLRLKAVIRGAVQGVGFRPFIYRLATEMQLSGWVSNTAQGVFIEVEGASEVLHRFLLRVEREKPAISFIQSFESSFVDPVGFTTFEIKESFGGEKTVIVLPDIATCPDCLREVLDPANRRYRYPFTNCTNCGPRFTIIESLPYDRPATTMKKFKMCAECEREYRNPLDRRFHAQPNACSVCGPHLELWSREGETIATHDDALRGAAGAIRDGKIVAAKGLGGFHLMVDARSDAAVKALRERKRREEKPFALMYPSLADVKRDCEVDELEERLLRSPESPIVLLRRKRESHVSSLLATGTNIGPHEVSAAVAPGNPYLGVLLPYTPLHQLLMSELGFPVVATSGNLSDEPICIDEHEAVRRLSGIADVFLVHDRPILRHVDDSIARIVLGRELVLRRARGFAPLPLRLDSDVPAVLGVGAHQKNTVASAIGQQVFVSQHIGDLETSEAYGAFERVIESFHNLYEFTPKAVACDLHPNYLSTRYAREQQATVVGVQHHYAHVLACMAENGIAAPVLGISWDGSGYGPDETVWGGEFLAIDEESYTRAAHLRTFRLPGSEKAVKEPRRVALGLLYAMFADAVFEREDLASVRAFTAEEKKVLRPMLARGVNSPATSSAGRLFDAVASLLDLHQRVRFEGQGAMELEFRAAEAQTDDFYPVRLIGEAPIVIDWAPMIARIMGEKQDDVPVSVIARKFHNALVEAMVLVAQKVGIERVALTGGCFQNKLLTERAVGRLQQEGFRVYWHQRIPPNDGGIAVGQVMAAVRELKKRK